MKTWRSDDGRVVLYLADCRNVLPALEPVETCITDPAYGLEFMGKQWDHGVPAAETWERVSAALLPGASLLAFGGTRTWHRLAVAIEDAGFELRDTMMWLYSSGFPKSLNISKAIKKTVVEWEIVGQIWNGWGTSLKPSWEPILVAMKPTDGTFVQNAITHGVAGINVEGCRIAIPDGESYNTAPACSGFSGIAGYEAGQGRMPENLPSGRWPPNVILDEETAVMLDGGVSRFFYVAKASVSEKTAGGDVDNKHPTVKPVNLMRWICRLTATPTNGTVLDPFMGTGSTGVAAILEGRGFIGIEEDESSFEVAVKRIREAGIYPDEDSKDEAPRVTASGQGKLF